MDNTENEIELENVTYDNKNQQEIVDEKVKKKDEENLFQKNSKELEIKILVNPEKIEENLYSNNKNLETKKSINIENIDKDVFESLDIYFVNVKSNKDIREKFVLFNQLFEKNSDNKDFVFLLFWYPFINSDELMVTEIINTTPINMGDLLIDNIFTIKVSSKELNNYAFDIALKNNFPESIILKIIKQGKIKLGIEWILQKIKDKAISLVEECWLGNNECYFESQKFMQNFADFYKKTLKINLDNKKDGKTESFSLGKTLIGMPTNRKVENSENNNLRNNNNSSLTKTQKEYQEFFNKNLGKLNISKLIMIANYHISITQDPTSQESKDNLLNIIRAMCIFDKQKKFSDNILEGLYLTKNKEIAAELLEANLLNVDISIFQTALRFKDLKFCLQFYNSYSDFKIFDKEDLHDEIIDRIFEDISNLEIYLFFIKKFSPFFKITSLKIFVKLIEELLLVTNQNNKIINNFSNPLKIFVLIAEILIAIKSKFPSLDSNIQRIIQKCMDYSENIQTLIEDDSVFREILLEMDLTKRSVLDIISQNNFLILLKNKLIEKIVDDLWSGPFDIQGSFLEVSSQYNSINVNYASKDYDIYTKQRGSFFSSKKKEFNSNFTHFRVWQKNIYSKYFVEVFIGFLLVLFGQGISTFYIKEYKNILNFDSFLVGNYSYFFNNLKPAQYKSGKDFINLNQHLFTNFTDFSDINSFKNNLTNLNMDYDLIFNLLGSKSLYLIFYENISNMNQWMTYLDYLFWFLLLLPFEYILRFFYMIKARKPNLGLTLYPDIGLIIFAFIIKSFTLDGQNIIKNILSNLSYDSVNDFDYLPYLNDMQNFISNDPYNYELLSLAVMCGLLWLRLILLIRGTKTFGPLIVIFLVSLKGVTKYVMLFLLVTFAYSCCAYLLFYRISGYYYQNPFYCFIYFFLISLGGEPSFDSYSSLAGDKPYIPFLGGVFLVSVLILNVIVFFNLIIALLSNIFETFKNYSLQLYIQKKLEIRKKYYDEDERFNSLLISYFPFNILTFPFGLSLLFMVDKARTKKLNKFIKYINYSFYAFFYTFFFCLITFILLPFTFLKICYSKFVQIFVDEIQQYFKAYKIISFLFYCLFGFIFQIKSYFNDIFAFFVELWKKKIPLTTDMENVGKYSIQRDILNIIMKMMKQNHKNDSFSQNIKISLEKFIMLISKQLDSNADIKYTEKLRFEDYNIEKEIFKKTENEENNFNLNNNFSKYSPIFQKQGFRFNEILDYLYNLCDNRLTVDITNIKNIIRTGIKTNEIRLFYANISDKNYKNYTSKKQLLFFNKIDTVLKIENKILNDIKNKISKTKTQGNLEDITETKILNENKNINFTNLVDENKSEDKEKNKIFKKFLKNKDKFSNSKFSKKILKSKNLFQLPDVCFIPLLTRTCIFAFYNDLKEYQNDLTKKISENILKNQKYLEEIVKEKKNLLGGTNTTNKIPKFFSKNKSSLINSEQENKSEKNFQVNNNQFENLEGRISNLENNMERLMKMTEKMLKLLDKTSKTNEETESENINKKNISINSERSSSTMKIEKYDRMSYNDDIY